MQTDRHIDIQTYRHTYMQTDKDTHIFMRTYIGTHIHTSACIYPHIHKYIPTRVEMFYLTTHSTH